MAEDPVFRHAGVSYLTFTDPAENLLGIWQRT